MSSQEQASNMNGHAKITEENQSCTVTPYPQRWAHEKFIRQSVEVLLQSAVFDGTEKYNPVLEWHAPDELQKLFNTCLNADRSSHDEMLKKLEEVVRYSVKTGNPFFDNQLYAGMDPYALVAEWAVAALNPVPYTYEVAPVFTLMENRILAEIRRLIGFPADGQGIFCPGGSAANMYALHFGRHRKFPDIKRKGLNSVGRLVVFASEESHYSLLKASSLLGIGTENLYSVRSDEHGRMIPAELEKMIRQAKKENAIPFAVVATVGTTVLGAIDPLEDIADICQEHELWLHVDAAYGGGIIFSPQKKHLLSGIERADSVAWNPHKMLCVIQQCSVLVIRHSEFLEDCVSAKAQYLFQDDKYYDTTYDHGDNYFQCGRKADVFKLWFMWKAKGHSGLAEHVDRQFDNAKAFTHLVEDREGFELVVKPQSLNVCFWYIPPSLRGKQLSKFYDKVLHTVAPKIKSQMVKRGRMLIAYQTSGGLPNFFRFVSINSSLNHEDLKFFLDEIEEIGKNLTIDASATSMCNTSDKMTERLEAGAHDIICKILRR